VRKQYHFRPGPDGLKAWDVDRLVSLSKTLVPEVVSIANICELDEPYWGHSMTCRGLAGHALLIQEADPTIPIILSSDGRVMDGMHRVVKALLMGLSHIPAVRFSADPAPDYVGVGPDDLAYEDESRTIRGDRDA
jgi:hypothetical protein